MTPAVTLSAVVTMVTVVTRRSQVAGRCTPRPGWVRIIYEAGVGKGEGGSVSGDAGCRLNRAVGVEKSDAGDGGSDEQGWHDVTGFF